jgi:hypothetical protein
MKVGRKNLLGAIAFFSFVVLVITLYKLLLLGFPSRQFFAVTFFGYSAAAVVFVHAILFFANLESREIRGRGLGKDVPRYLDYVVTILIAIGLIKIFFSEDIFAKYIEEVNGTRQEIATKIVRQADAHLKEDCGTKKEFTLTYCKKLDAILNTKNIDDYIVTTLGRDTEFLEHPIGYQATAQESTILRSPIERYVNQYTTLTEYSVAPYRSSQKSAWDWVALVLLPFVLAFRATKTSLELYADLS